MEMILDVTFFEAIWLILIKNIGSL